MILPIGLTHCGYADGSRVRRMPRDSTVFVRKAPVRCHSRFRTRTFRTRGDDATSGLAAGWIGR